ncbi:hypothetical protein SEA_SATIS_95 [Streptomyces phage Satis]|nr:hypothetical protein SEA_SATIS_95 [Streptomyces phage Satis]QBZ71993.1 hypothetical protein SEA_KRADAL_95 [Streptomyces phage Kradal]QPL14412.1 hypothetical protein SEA_EHYELIMAYOE_95 [Streptomyces phage EhyElimayoE]
MAEFTVRVWRRKQHLLRPLHVKEGDLEEDVVSVEAPDRDSALRQVLRAEYDESDGKRFRAYAQIDTASGGHVGLGDLGIMRHRDEIAKKAFIEKHCD